MPARPTRTESSVAIRVQINAKKKRRNVLLVLLGLSRNTVTWSKLGGIGLYDLPRSRIARVRFVALVSEDLCRNVTTNR